MESGAPSSNLIVDSPESAKARVIRFAKKLNCSIDEKLETTMGCLEGKSVEALQAISEGDFVANDFFIPVYVDEVLPVKPEVALAKGEVNDVDLIVSGNFIFKKFNLFNFNSSLALIAMRAPTLQCNLHQKY